MLKTSKKSKKPAGYLLLIPAVIIMIAGFAYPVIWQLYTSTQEFGLAQQFGSPSSFIGLENYFSLIQDGQFWQVLLRSIVFCLLCALCTMIIGFAFAALMNVVPKLPRIIFQISLLLAWAVPVTAVMTIWIWLFDRRKGVINFFLDKIPGVDMNRFNWFDQPATFFLVAGIIVVWMSVPFVAFSIYAALSQVSGEVIEAASLDGANFWKRTKYIIIPMIKPVIAIVLLLQIIWDLRVFAQIKILQEAGGSGDEFDLLGTYIYDLGLGTNSYGLASAASVLVLLVTIMISFYYVRTIIKEEK